MRRLIMEVSKKKYHPSFNRYANHTFFPTRLQQHRTLSTPFQSLMEDEPDPEGYQNLSDEEYNKQHERFKEKLANQNKINKELFEKRTGRLYDDPFEISDELFATTMTIDDLPDWTPSVVSRVANEMISVVGIPSLLDLTDMKTSLPNPPPPHPATNSKAYARYAVRRMKDQIASAIPSIANSRLQSILATSNENVEEQQVAIDELYEYIEYVLRERFPVMAAHPSFPKWTEIATRAHLIHVNENLKTNVNSLDLFDSDSNSNSDSDSDSSSESDSDDADADADAKDANDDKAKDSTRQDLITETVDFLTSSMETTKISENESKDQTKDTTISLPVGTMNQNDNKKPIFMDLYQQNNDAPRKQTKEERINALFPVTGVYGNIKEEWELSAHDEALRIMIRKCTTDIATILTNLEKESSLSNHIFLTGKRGVGKTTVLTSIVASARESGYIVLYLSDGARLAEHGYFIQPSAKRQGIYDLPMLSKDLCMQLLEAHSTQMEKADLRVTKEIWNKFFTTSQINKQLGFVEDDNISLIELLEKVKNLEMENVSIAAGIYSCAVHVLMSQTDVPFLAVLDAYNAYHYPRGHYYHMHYDENVRKSIPYDQINLFAPFMKSFQQSSTEKALGPKRGAILASMTYSCPLPIQVSKQLEEDMKARDHVEVVEVPHFTKIEMDHVLANYECIGVGKFRFDEGKTLTDEQEMAFLRMHSGGVGTKLLDGIMI